MAMKRKFEIDSDDIPPIVRPLYYERSCAPLTFATWNSKQNNWNLSLFQTWKLTPTSSWQRPSQPIQRWFIVVCSLPLVQFPPAHRIHPSEIHVSCVSINTSPPRLMTNVAAYPTFDLYPLPFFSNNGSVEPNSHNFSYYAGQLSNSQVGLMQPSNSFVHHR